MCGSGASRHTTSVGLYPSGKVASLSSRDQGVVLAPSSRRVKIPSNPGTMGSGFCVAGTMHWCEGWGGLEGWRDACLYLGGGEGRGWGGREFVCSLLSGPGRSCLTDLRRILPERAVCLVLCWGNPCYLFAWTCKRATKDARALMISRIWSS